MRRRVRLTETDLHRIIRNVLKEEIDTGQVLSASERRYSKSTDSPKIREIEKKIRQLRRMIGEYEDEGKDISGLQKQIKQLKKQAGFTNESLIRGIIRKSVKNVLKESNQMQFLEDDLRNYFKIDKEYDGSVSMANARNKLLNSCCGDLPWEVNERKFLNMIYSLPSSWNVESLTQRAMEWVEQESRKKSSPKIY